MRDEVLLPTSALKWITSKPDSVLSVVDSFMEMDQVQYSTGHKKYVSDPWQGMLVKRDINGVLESIVAAMGNELGFAFDSCFGTDENQWVELNLLTKVRMIVAQASSRFTVGLPLCMKKAAPSERTC